MPSDFKSRFEQELETIKRQHRLGASGLRTAAALTRRLDRFIGSTYRRLTSPHKDLIAVVALGGYGRQELCFGSDTDVMFLVAGEKEKMRSTDATKEFVRMLFDAGLTVGHSFRTIGECLDNKETDDEIWNSLLESRFVCGGKRVFTSFRSKMQAAIVRGNHPGFIGTLWNGTNLRHQKYGSSAKLLEPNVKHSSGGLRDIHIVLWLMRGTGSLKLPPVSSSKTAVRGLLDYCTKQNVFPSEFIRGARGSFEFLLRVRNEMHLQSNAVHDSLDFMLQPQVAEALKYRDSKTRSRVEHFMQDYYLAAKTVDMIQQRGFSWVSDMFHQRAPSAEMRKLGMTFLLRDHKIEHLSGKARIGNHVALQAFLYSAEFQAPLSFQLEDKLHRNLKQLRPLRTQTETELWFRILKGKSVARTIRRMNDLGILERWIPEWKPMVAFFQHNVYHFFTVDEHTLNVLANAERLETSESSFGKVFRSLPDRTPLYLACLLHDIAKPIQLGDHEVEGVNVSRAILERLRYHSRVDDVLFLVRHHLLMEQVAFRRNLNDPHTIIDFASKIANVHQLDLLYLLTYADLAAVNKNVWTSWKESLLFDLYRKAHDVLERNMTAQEVELAASQKRQKAIRELVSTLTDSGTARETESHLMSIDSPSYLASFNADEIAAHLRNLRAGEAVSTIFRDQTNSTDVTILSKDAPFALSKFCGVLSANDANIIDANIFTRDDGMIIDKFRVVDDIAKSKLSHPQLEKIERELKDVMAGTVHVEELLKRHRMKWRRRTLHHNPNVRIDVEFEEHPRYTIIDVYAPDMLGFLYKLTETISRLGLNISFAKIATRGDGIVDSFYVLDLTGQKLDHQGRRRVKQEILQVVATLSESELVAA